MTCKAHLPCRSSQICIVFGAVNIVTTKASYSAPIHQTLNKVISLHPVFVAGTVGEMGERCLTQFVFFKLPKVLQVKPLMKSNRPIVVLTFKGVRQRLTLRMALNAGVIGTNEVQPCRVNDILPSWALGVFASRTVASFTTNVPFRHSFCFDVVVDRVTAITQWPRRSLQVIGRVERHPPVRIRLDEIRTPQFVTYVPLGRQRKVIIANLLKVPLLPL